MSQHGSNPVASVGRIVHYRVTEKDLYSIRFHHPGTLSVEGDILPMLIVRVWVAGGSGEVAYVSGRLFVDGEGPGSIWLPKVEEGTEPGQWYWPERT